MKYTQWLIIHFIVITQLLFPPCFSLFLFVPLFLSLRSTIYLSVGVKLNSHARSALTVHYPCKCCRMIRIAGRGKYRIIL
jgi:hypothetical protein